jgi:hypothetical protein
MDPPSSVYSVNIEGDCVANPPGTGQYYEAIASPPTDWAAVDRRVFREAPAFGVEVWQGQDGSRIRGTSRLLPEDVECAPVRADGCAIPLPWAPPLEDPSYCAPAHPGQVGPWSKEQSCSSTGFVTSMPKCDPQPFAFDYDDGIGGESCSEARRRFWRVGAPVTSGIWLNFFGKCTAWDCAEPDTVFHERGTRVATTHFPRLDFVRSSAGALERLGWAPRGGESVLPSDRIGWSDAAAGIRRTCIPVTFADGTVLCAPPDSGFGGWKDTTLTSAYSDPACSSGSKLDVFAVELRALRAPDVGTWIVPDPALSCTNSGVAARQITAQHQGTVHGILLGFCIQLPAYNWFVADLGPPRPARDVFPKLDARGL